LRGGGRFPPRRRFLLIAVGLSVAVHLGAALLIVFLPRVMPKEAGPRDQGAVELLMVEQKGAEPGQASPPQESPPTPPQPAKNAQESKQEVHRPDTQATASTGIPTPVAAESADAPPPTEETPRKTATAEDKPDAQPSAVPPAPRKSQEAPVFDLAGTESESNAIVLGGKVLPASPDNRFRNRPPIYPREAAMLGEHGAVLLMIHVSEAGLATGVDVAESSGVASLDQAAIAAVRKWRFHPALREGRAVPFDMPFRFVFEAD
jgi:periplasmic protein TonB